MRVGQIWRDPYSRHTDGLRLVRIDKIETRTTVSNILGMQRTVETTIARVSSKIGHRPEFLPVNRFIKIERFGRFYRLHKDVP